MDVWGAIYRDQWSGIDARHEIERDDDRVETFDSAANYFSAPRSSDEREMLGDLEGPVLDLAAGPGSYALYLQGLGFDVTAGEHSPGAVEVCRQRGCRTVVPMDIRNVTIEPGKYGSIIVMENTLGAHQTPATFPRLLRTFWHGVKPGGRLLFTMIDPLDTTDKGHLDYQRRNRDRGLPPGLIRMRVRYAGQVEDWMFLWMLTDDELRAVTSETGWAPVKERKRGFWRVRLFEKTRTVPVMEGGTGERDVDG